MNKKIKLTLMACLLLLINNLSNAQNCGLELPPEQIQYMNDTRIERENTDLSLYSNEDEKINLQIAVHIIRDDNGGNGLTNEDLDIAMDDLNIAFEPTNFRFHICSVNYIDNDLFAYGNLEQGFEVNPPTYQTLEYQMAKPYVTPDNIDVFFVPTLRNNLSGWASFPALLHYYDKDWIVVNSSMATNGSTLAHEMGHYFSLYHTHQGSHDVIGWGDELVNGSNCGDNVGDEVCDTPADPTGLVNDSQGGKYQIGYCTIYQNCEFSTEHTDHNCNFTDANGALYKPDTRNVMSYNYAHCRTRFSQGQINRMYESYNVDRNYLSNYCEVTCDNMFIVYDWLSELSCQESESTNITIYKYNEALNYIDIQSGNERNLYVNNGILQCSGSAVTTCIPQNAEIIAECSVSCSITCSDVDACNFGEAGTCVYAEPNDNCEGVSSPCTSIFEQYPWLENEVAGRGEEITVYNYADSYHFIDVQTENDRTLYFENGTGYCFGSQVETCIVDLYQLTEVLDECTYTISCEEEGCTDPQASNYNPNADCEDDSCIYICEDVNACNFGEEEVCDYGNTECGDPCDQSSCNTLACASIFEQYPWIENEVSGNGEQITVYNYADSYHFIDVQTDNNRTLFFEDGAGYCFGSQVETCIVDLYKLKEVLDQCTYTSSCEEEGCTDPQAANYNPNADCEDESCIYICEDVNACNFGEEEVCDYGNLACPNPCNESTCIIPDCEKFTGTIIFEGCGGNTYRLVKTDDGLIYDPYFHLVDIDIYEGQRIKFDFEDYDEINTPCTQAEKAITITCIEEIEGASTECDHIFEEYPKLLNEVDPNNCANEGIKVYLLNDYYTFFYLYDGESGVLYLETTWYGSDSGDFSVTNNYDLTEIASWTCGCSSSNQASKTGYQTTIASKTSDLINANTFTMYPNPTKGLVNIELTSELDAPSAVTVFELSGKMVHQSTFTGHQTTLNLHELVKGMYIIEVENHQSKSIQKLVIE